MERHSAWTSSVGASVALNDLDRDGLSNDICYVDTRTNQIIIAPAPGTAKRYQPFALKPAALAYDQQTIAPMGCLPGDLNEDGLVDLLTYYWGRTPIAYLKKQTGDGAGAELSGQDYVQHEIVPGRERWFTNAATLADLDGDGHTDLIIGNYYQDNARILDASAAGSEQMQHSMSRASNGGSSRFLLWAGATTGNQPTVQFNESKNVLDDPVTYGWTLAVGAADLDGDLLPEVYFANDFGPDRLLHNRSKPGELRFALLEGKRSLTTPRSKVVGHDSFKGMGVDFGDVNQDGLLDIYVSNIASEYALEESHFLFTSTGKTGSMQQGVAPYVDRSEPLGLSRSGWGWDSKFGDFDNDGTLEALQATGFTKGTVNRWPELHELAMGNDNLLRYSFFWPRFQPGDDLSGHQHNPFFVRAKNGRYYDLAQDLGIDSTEVSRGIATADVDGDGDLDFAIANQWEASYFYQNNSSHPGTFLGLHLLRRLDSTASITTIEQPGHPRANLTGQPAIGATATVYLPNDQKLVAQVDGGNGHSGARSPDLHFGLGQLPQATPLPVDLSWRDIHGQVHQLDSKKF
ncbi:MAG: FG-GAP-like repeat-containing protein, partial [Nodosilinea sp.]